MARVRLLGGAKPDLGARPRVEQLEGDRAELRRRLAVELQLELLVPRGRALRERQVLLGQAWAEGGRGLGRGLRVGSEPPREGLGLGRGLGLGSGFVTIFWSITALALEDGESEG